MLIKATEEDPNANTNYQEKVYQNTNFSWRNAVIRRSQRVCQVIYVFFGSSFDDV